MRAVVVHRLAKPASPGSLLARHAWKLGLAVVVAAMLTARGTSPPQVHSQVSGRNLAATSIPCTPLPAGVTTWDASMGSIILPTNDTLLDPNACVGGIVVPYNATLIIDGSKGAVLISSHGAGISVQGGELETMNTNTTSTVTFDAEPEVATWDGISISADSHRRGDASLSYVSIQHALTAITITSGALSSPASGSYALTVSNSGIGPSYFDGIDATNTPISITGLGDGQFGTVNNIGSQGIKVTFDPTLPNYPAAIPAKSLDVENMTFGSSVPFGETNCVPLQPCAAGTIGNDAIQASFAPNAQEPLLIKNNQFFRAGSYGLELTNANNPAITSNVFTCNGSGSPTPVATCTGTGLRYPAIYLNKVANLSVASGGLTNNKGQQNGLDAIILNGQVVTDLPWQTPTNDSNAPSLLHPPHALGYMVANGDLEVLNAKLTVLEGDVVKVKGGAIVVTNGTLDAASGLDANGNPSPAPKTFTSMRDNGVGIQACPSVFVQSCPAPIQSNEWIGIDLSASTARVDNANILFPTRAIGVSGSAALITGPDGGSYGLVLNHSRIGPTFSDSVSSDGLPIYVAQSAFCAIDAVANDTNYGHCIGSGPGNRGINASYAASAPAQGGLKILNNDFRGSTDESILGTGLAGRPVDIENNTVEGAGTYGMQLASADNLTLKNNVVTGSGTGNANNPTTYPAIYLNGVNNADFSGAIAANSGSGNGLNAIVFHGATASAKPLNWQTVGSSTQLGYVVDGDLTVNGDLTLVSGDYAPVLGGTIAVKGHMLTATGATFTTLKRQTASLPSCGSVFLLKVSGACPPPTAGDWGGLVLDSGLANVLTGSDIGYATTGISVGLPSGLAPPQNLTLTQTNIHNTTSDGVHSQSPLAITGGVFSNNGGHGIDVVLSSASPWPITIAGHAAVSSSGLDGILATGLAGEIVQIQDTSVDHGGGYGIDLVGADHLTLTNNTVTNSAPTFAAIYLNGFAGPFAGPVFKISDNKGAGNGLDALAFHGTVTDDLIWQTARKTSDPTKLLGYLLDDTLSMQPGHTLTINAGDIVKVGRRVGGGVLDLQGANLRADSTATSSQKIFTSLTDNSAGVVACPSALLPGCSAASAGDWSGISLSGSGANGALVNTAIRYAATGITISSGASSTSGSSSFGLTISRSSFDHIQLDAIDSAKTALSVTDSSVTGAGARGVNADLTGASLGTPLRFSGNRFQSTSAEAILGQALAGQPVWITDNHVRAAGTFGIRLLGADELVLRNNNISNSGGGPGAGAAGYPAIYLNGIVGDFTRNIRGNVGSGNGLDVIAFHGTANGDLPWQTPTVNASTAPLGYVLDGSLTVSDGTLTVHPGDVVKSLGGPITVRGGVLDASSTDPRTRLFTSLKDQSAYPQTCPSVLTGVCGSGAQPGDWGGIAITDDVSGRPGSASLVNSRLAFAATGLSINSGPAASFGSTGFGLIVSGTTVSDVTGDGLNAQDTPISVVASTIQRIGVHGIIATFLGGTPCVTSCSKSLDIEHVTIANSGKDGIVASGLGGRPTIVSDNLISSAGTYGIRLAGADQLTLNRNTVNSSGGPATTFRYPAIYLGGVKADFELVPGTTTVAANHGLGNGLDAMVVHGEATQPITWLTTGVTAPVVSPLVPADHFGYLLDGGFTVDGMLTTNPGDIVKMLGGAIQVNGSLVASNTIFTSLKDPSFPVIVCTAGYDSVFLQRISGSCPAAAGGDWAGIIVSGAATLTNVAIGFDDGLTVTGGGLVYAGGTMHDIARNAIVVNGSGVSVTNVAFARVGNDAIDSSSSGPTDTITDDQFDHVNGVAVNLQSSQADLQRNVFTNDGSPAVKAYGAPVSIQCSSLQSGGITGDAQLSVRENDFSAGVGLTAPAAANADSNWWGQATGPSGQLSGGVSVNSYFTTQNPSATIAITGKPSATQLMDPVKSDGSLGTGLVQAILTFSRNMSREATLPSVSYASNPVSFTGVWNDPRSWTGDAPIDASLATNGTHTVSAAGAHDCVPDLLHNLMTPASNTFVADTTSLPTVSTSAADLIGAHSAEVHGHIVPLGWATGAAHSGQFVLTNLASPFDQHTYATPPLLDKTTAVDFSLTATGLSPSSTYSVQLHVPSVNGTAVEATAGTVTTTAPASKVVFTSSPPSSIVAGVPFSAVTTTEDPSGSVVSDFSGNLSVALTASGSATLSGTLTKPVVNGVASFGGLSVDKTGSYTVTATSNPALTPGASNPFGISPAAASQLLWSGVPLSATAGTPVSGTLTAKDPFNNVATGYLGSVALTSTDGAAVLSPTPYTFVAGDAGVHSFSLTFKTAGLQTVIATDAGNSLAVTSGSVAVSPAAATHFDVTGYPSPTMAGVSHSVTVTARDAFNNTATGYSGTVVLTSTDAFANISTFVGVSSGTTTFDVTLKTAATQSLTATDSVSPSITGTESGIVVNPAAATHFDVTGYPSPTMAGASHSVTVTARDAFNNTATGYSGTVVLTSTDAFANISTFVGVSSGATTFDVTLKTAATQSLTATDSVSPSITGTESGIVVNPAAATHFDVTGYPSPTMAGVSHSVTVTARDAFNNTATGYSGTVVLTSTDAFANISTFVGVTSGTTTFDVTLKTAATQSLTATDSVSSSITGTESGIVVNPAAASQLLWSGVPLSATAGTPVSGTLTAKDPFNNVATGYLGSVALTSTDGAAVLSPTPYTFVAGDAGVHGFSLTFKTAGGQTVTATDAGNHLAVTSGSVAVSPAAAAQLLWSGVPLSATAGTPVGGTLTAKDPFNNVATGYLGSVALTSTDGAAVLTPSPYTFVAGDAGVHSFSLAFKTAGAQIVTATDAGHTLAVTSGSVAVSPAAASQLLWSGVPLSATAGTPVSGTLTAKDPFSNVATGYLGSVALTSTDGAALLSPTPYTFVAGDAGVHGFSLTIKTAGGQTVTATDAGHSLTVTSGSVAVSPAAASQLLWSGVPLSATAGTPVSGTLTAKDPFNNVATGYLGSVALTSTDGAAVLSPTPYTFVAGDAGVHSFSLTFKTAGGQTVTATDAGNHLAVTSGSVAVSPAAASQLLWSGVPLSATAGTPVSGTLTAKDPFNNVATGYLGSVALTSSDGAAVLSPTPYTFVAGDAGVHSFSLTFKTAGGQTVTATDAGHTLVVTSSSVAVSPAAASQLLWSGVPVSATAGTPAGGTLTAKDPFNNVATGYLGTVALSSTDGAAVLSPAPYTFVAGDAGVHSFSLTFKTAGGQTVTATDAGHTLAVTSGSVTVSPAAAAQLLWSGVPLSATAGTPVSGTLTAKDPFNNVATGYLGSVALTSTDGAAVLTPSPYTFVAGDAGVHSFSLTFKTAGAQTVTATDAGNILTVTSSSVTVSPAAASQLLWSGVPLSATAGTPVTGTLTAKDPFNNVATGYLGSVALTSTDGAAVLSPTPYTFVAGDAGVHSFSLTFKTAGGQTVTATDAGHILTVTSGSVAVSPGAAAQLLWSGVPLSATAGTPVSGTLTAKDPFNNVATGYVGTVALSSTDGAAVLSPTPYTFVAGDAGMHGFSLTFKTAGGQTVTATDAGHTLAVTSNSVGVGPGGPNKLAFQQQPSSASAGTAIMPAITVQIQDQFGNLTADGSTVTVAIGTNPSSGTLSGTLSMAASAGTAAFGTLSINKAGNGYTLTASDASLMGATSIAFNVTAPTATTLSSAPTSPFPSPPTVTITATVTATGAASPGTGSVAFTAAGLSISAACDTAPVSTGQATCVTDYASINGKALAGTYSGGTAGGVTYTGSTSGTLKGTTITMSHAGIPAVFTATINGGPSGSGDGSVTFLANGVVLCTVSLFAGAASCTPSPALAAGTVVTEIYVPSAGSSFASSDATDTA